jgi:hypothetical protein
MVPCSLFKQKNNMQTWHRQLSYSIFIRKEQDRQLTFRLFNKYHTGKKDIDM